MEVNRNIVIEGLEDVIKKDLEKHKLILEQTKSELDTYNQSVSHLVKRKKNYSGLKGGGKYNDKALTKSIAMIQIDITAISNKAKLAREKIEHTKVIVDTLTVNLENQYKSLKVLKDFKNGTSR